MLILSGTWLLVVITCVAGHWALPTKLRGWFVVTLSAAFLGAMSPISLIILSGFTLLLHFGAGRENRISGKRLTGYIFIISGILSLYKFKAAFTPQAMIDIDPLTESMLIPLGISYYAFRCIHYAIEKYKGTIPAHGFDESAQYLFFLPTFLAGPIHRFHDFQRDLRRKRWDTHMFAQGVERMLIGYFQVSFVANLLVNNWLGVWIRAYTRQDGMEMPSLEAYLTMIKTTLNLYFQFAGFSSIAIGFGMMIGIKVMENFNFPFLARNISDFWRRWHISLTSWCRDYVYMGTISITRSAALAAVAAMLVMGLWHEFSLRFVIWGAYHGIGIMIWQRFQDIKPHLPQVTNIAALKGLQIGATILTLHYFMFGVLIAHYSSLEVAFNEWQKILLFWI